MACARQHRAGTTGTNAQRTLPPAARFCARWRRARPVCAYAELSRAGRPSEAITCSRRIYVYCLPEFAVCIVFFCVGVRECVACVLFSVVVTLTSTVKHPKYATQPAASNTSPTTFASEAFSTSAFSDHRSFSPPRPPSRVSALRHKKRKTNHHRMELFWPGMRAKLCNIPSPFVWRRHIPTQLLLAVVDFVLQVLLLP